MGKYIKYYDTHSEYDGEKDFLDEPNVAWCELEEDVHYGPEIDYSKEYLTFTIVEDGTLIWHVLRSSSSYTAFCNISYSTDNGTTWIEISPSDTPFLNVTLGLKILFKGNNQYYCTYYNQNYESSYCCNCFSGTAFFNLSGNIMSMIGGDNFENITAFDYLQTYYSAFYRFFEGCNIINAKKLLLPALTLKMYCYYKMFLNCTSLITAPVLPATTLASSCYTYMFYGCTSLNYIKAMFTTTPGSSYTYNWVSSVASTGTFVKNSAATWTTTGANGVPTGWTIITADS